MKDVQVVGRKGSAVPAVPDSKAGDSLRRWLEAYFRFDVATATQSQKMQRRDLEVFLEFMELQEGHTQCHAWRPRLSRDYLEALRKAMRDDDAKVRRFSDRTINRMLAHLKTFASWVHKHRPFPLGHPTDKLPALPTTTLLIEERGLTAAERRRMLDAADLLLQVGGRSVDRHRHKAVSERSRRKLYRPRRNRAIIYCLIETGMRRAAVANVDLAFLDPTTSTIEVVEKGGEKHPYKISREGLEAILDYVDNERNEEELALTSPALFLPASGVTNAGDRLSPKIINRIWNEVRTMAGVDQRKTPHSARHGMGRHLIEKTGNVAAVQRQLGHKNAAYSLQYMRITAEELKQVLDDR